MCTGNLPVLGPIVKYSQLLVVKLHDFVLAGAYGQ